MKERIKIKHNSKIMVKGAEYTIRWRKLIMENKEECYGLHDPEKRLILLSKDMKPKEYVPVFLHELFHAYMYECGIREGIPIAIEEIIVDALALAVDIHFDLSWKK